MQNYLFDMNKQREMPLKNKNDQSMKSNMDQITSPYKS